VVFGAAQVERGLLGRGQGERFSRGQVRGFACAVGQMVAGLDAAQQGLDAGEWVVACLVAWLAVFAWAEVVEGKRKVGVGTGKGKRGQRVLSRGQGIAHHRGRVPGSLGMVEPLQDRVGVERCEGFRIAGLGEVGQRGRVTAALCGRVEHGLSRAAQGVMGKAVAGAVDGENALSLQRGGLEREIAAIGVFALPNGLPMLIGKDTAQERGHARGLACVGGQPLQALQHEGGDGRAAGQEVGGRTGLEDLKRQERVAAGGRVKVRSDIRSDIRGEIRGGLGRGRGFCALGAVVGDKLVQFVGRKPIQREDLGVAFAVPRFQLLPGGRVCL